MRRDRDKLMQQVQAAAVEQAGLAEEPARPMLESLPVAGPSPATEPTHLPLAAAVPSSAVQELLSRSPQERETVTVHGYAVRLSEEQRKKAQICTTVYLPIDLREAVRQAEQEVGVSYQEFVRIAVGQLLEQLSAAKG